MALRLTGTSLAPQGPPSATELAARARALLAAENLDGYHELFTRAAEHEDLQRRYQARVALLEEGLAAAGQGSAGRVTQLFATVARAAIEVLEEEPREPVILNHAGIAFYEVWSLDAAQALFKAAHRLDPTLPHLKRNLTELERRRRSGLGPRGQLKPLHATLPALVQKAKRIAERARPATGLTLSLCMIVRDEEEMLPRCLEAAKAAVDEIVIVDTGSKDRTIEIARSFGAKVIEREWTGSFSDARNVSFEAATGDWILYLDADEVLVAQDAQRLRAITGQVWREAFYLVETNYSGEEGDGTAMVHNALRVFRNRPHYRFEGRLHEQIAQHLPVWAPRRLAQTSIRVEHFGYLGAVRNAKEKSKRNIELLLEQQREGVATPFQHFNLGSEYQAVGDQHAALASFERAWEAVKDRQEDFVDFAPTLVVRLVTALQACGRIDEAQERAREGLEAFDGYTDLVYAQGLLAVDRGRYDDAVAAWERCIELGDAPVRFGAATVGAGTYLPKVALADLYRRRGDATRAQELLERCLADHPNYMGAVLPYALLLLGAGMAADAVSAAIEQRVDKLTATVRFMLATAFFQRGAMEAAEQQFRAVLESRPSNGQARVQLAETLLHLRRYADAAAESATVPADGPFSALAGRIELWGRIAAQDIEGARTTLATAPAAGLSRAELELFTAWTAIAAGESAPAALTVAATPLLGVILETLLRTHDFETFEALVPLLLGSGLPRREQQEVLANMYLRYGFLASAAKEWMDVCAERPDARALVGLSRVASAHGLPEDAVTFAAEALQLDPMNATARQLLSHYEAAAAAV